MKCPGSIRLSEGLPNRTSVFAQEGTRAHAVAELCLTKKVDAITFVGMTIEGGVVTEDMADYVQIFVTYCQDVAPTAAYQYWVEKRFNLAALNPPAPMFGTADFVAYDARSKTLHVVDLKYGQGVVVEVKDNPQLRYYALGAAISMPTGTPIETVVITIVQPRAAHQDGPIRSETIDFLDLVGFAGELMEYARKTTLPNAPLAAGDHCKFCPVSGRCPEQRNRAQLAAQSDFAVQQFVPPAPGLIPDAQFFGMLGQLHILDEWMKAMRAHALVKLERGEEVPGFKLVAKRATRKWSDPAATAEWLLAKGNTPDEIYQPADLKSPAQIEKLIGKKNLPGDHTHKQSSGLSMVAETDVRPAVILTLGSEFSVTPMLTAGPSTEGLDDTNE
jgi:hypothetical protein